LRLAGEDLDDIRVRLYGHDGKPLLLGGPAGNQLQVVAVNPDGTPLVGAHTDDAPFTPASDDGAVAFALADEVSPDSVDEGDVGAVRMSLDRILYVRPHGIRTVQLLASGTRSSTTWSADQTNQSALGVFLYLNITGRTVGAVPSINVRIQAKGPTGGAYQNLFISSNFDPGLALHLVCYYPGIENVDPQVSMKAGTPLPLTWRAGVVFNADVTDLTYSFDACYIY
jgi:hypothetical protein